MLKRILGFVETIPFIGKYKTVIGAVGVATGTVATVCFDAPWGADVTAYGLGWMGLGIAHGKLKANRTATP